MAGEKQKIDLQHAELQASAKAVQYQVLLQFGSRLLTFVLNGFIIRYVSKELLGIVNIRLMLLYTTIQFLSREGFRRACTQNFGSFRSQWKPVVNLLWLNIPLSVVFATALSALWYYGFSLPPCDSGQRSFGCYYAYGIVAYAAAACIESIAEPFFVTAQAYHFVRTRVLIQGAAITLQTFVNVAGCLGIVRGWSVFDVDGDRSQYMLLVFAFAQLCYSASICLMYMLYFTIHLRRRKNLKAGNKNASVTNEFDLPMKSVSDFLPAVSVKDAEYWFSTKHARLAYSFAKQSIIKQLLTEGERYIMTITRVIDFHQQGIYDIVNNLGALCVRTIFAPLEENAYLFFSRAFPRCLHDDEESAKVEVLSKNLTSFPACEESEPLCSDDAGVSIKPAALQRLGGKGDADETESSGADPSLDISPTEAEYAADAKLFHRKKRAVAPVPQLRPAVEVARLSDAEKRYSLDTLFHLLRFVVLLGLTAFTYGFNYCDILLRVYGGNELAQNGTVMMQSYCFYLVFLAINGILEAFAFAIMTDAQVQQSSSAFLKISIFYVLMALLFTWRGHATGFILANCCNMLARIVYSYSVASRYLERFTRSGSKNSTTADGKNAYPYNRSSSLILHAVVPHVTVLKTLLVAIFFCYISRTCIYQGTSSTALFSLATLGHLLIGGQFGLITLWSVWKFEQETVVFIASVMRGKTPAAVSEGVIIAATPAVTERTKVD